MEKQVLLGEYYNIYNRKNSSIEIIVEKDSVKNYFCNINSESNIVIFTSVTARKNVISYLKDDIDVISFLKSFIIDSNKIIGLRDLFLDKDVVRSEVVIAIGGGIVVDVAKVVAYTKRKKLIVIPSILSTNVFSTNKSVIKNKNNALRTVPSKMPDILIIDEKFIKISNMYYSLLGISDILSTYTALYDWRLAYKYCDERYVEAIAKISELLSLYIKKHAENIINETDKYIEEIAKMLLLSGAITRIYGSGRPESGSEHIFARAIEQEHKGPVKILHGEAVLLGVLICSELQQQKNEFVYNIANRLNLLCVLEAKSISKEKLIKYLLIASKLRPGRFTIFNILEINYSVASEIIDCVLLKLRSFND